MNKNDLALVIDPKTFLYNQICTIQDKYQNIHNDWVYLVSVELDNTEHTWYYFEHQLQPVFTV